MSKRWQVKAPVRKSIPAAEKYTYELGGACYYIPWKRVSQGASFIIPTVLSAYEVARAFTPAASFFGYELLCEEILWFDMTAVRVHRVN